MALSERDRAILAFEASWWTRPGSKEEAVKASFGISISGYRRILAVLVDTPEAEALDPLLVRRLRRARDQRRRARYEGKPAGGAGGRPSP
jgi:hypothetical protein